MNLNSVCLKKPNKGNNDVISSIQVEGTYSMQRTEDDLITGEVASIIC